MDDKDDILAYHGTPHDFERFDLSKIGTGQGQQAYGHGLYFASDEDLARSYRDDLSSGAQVLDDRPVSEIAREAIKADQPSSEQRIAQYVSQYGRMARNVMSMREPHLLDQYDELTASQRLKPAGKMYEVRIKAHPDTFLDWDKPLFDQPAIVKMLQEQHANLDPDHEKFKFLNDAHNNMMNERSNGSHAHHYLKLALGSEGASQYLNGLGVKGIRYKDTGSRGVGGGTTNYVVFDDSLINIARKYRKGGAVQAMATGGEIRKVKPAALIPVIRYGGKIYRPASDPTGGVATHMDALKSVPPEFRSRATLDASSRGYVNERGRFLDRFRAQQYAVENQLHDESMPSWVKTAPELVAEWLKPPQNEFPDEAQPVINPDIVKATGGHITTLRRMSDPAVNEAIRVINRSGSSPRDAVTLSKRLLGRQ